MVRALVAEIGRGLNGTNLTIGVNCSVTVTSIRLELFPLGVNVLSVVADELVQ